MLLCIVVPAMRCGRANAPRVACYVRDDALWVLVCSDALWVLVCSDALWVKTRK